VIPGRYDVIAVDFGGTLATTGRPGAPDRPVDEDAAEALWRLHTAGYGLVLSSNTPGRSRRPALQQAGVDELICAYVESHECGVAKPARAFYRQVVVAADCPANRILHIGNRLDGDVLVPIAVGMDAVYVCPYPTPDACLPRRAAHVRRFSALPSLLGRLT
jgi:FMN phosphatase YigB (HAD superfamily)